MKLSAAIILGVLASASAAQALDGGKNAAWYRIFDDAVRMKWQFSRDCCPKEQPPYCTLTLVSPTEDYKQIPISKVHDLNDSLMLRKAAGAGRLHGPNVVFFGVYW
jgi:hypothetical protein